MMFSNVKSVVALTLICASLWGGYEIYRTWQDNPSALKAPVKSSVVKTIALRGQNLTLDQPWVVRTLALPTKADLMEIDLFALREKLMASGQVRTASLTRKFPDTLVVLIEERSPVARVMAKFGEGDPETFLVARDGVVYRGECYKDEVTQSLPYLGGVKLKRSGGKFLPIEGMETVADLLSTARINAPELYRSWTVVSLEKLVSEGQIAVQSPEAGEVVFGTRNDFYGQVARLDYILAENRAHPGPTAIKSINLAVGAEQVPVVFDTPPPPPAPEHGATRSKPTPARVASVQPPPATVHPSLARATPTRPTQTFSTSTPLHRPSRRDF